MALSSGTLNSPTKLRSLRHFVAAVSSVSSRILHAGLDKSCISSKTGHFGLYNSLAEEDGDFLIQNSKTSARGPLFDKEEDNESEFLPSWHWMNGYSYCNRSEARLQIHSPLTFASRFRKYASSSSQRSLSGGVEVHLWSSKFRQGKSELVSSPILRNFRRTHVGHAHHNTPGQHDNTGKAGERVLRWGLWGDILLSIGKGGAGFVSGSTAIIADAAHSVSDIALSGVALWSSKVASAPKDKEHPYGHGKFETLGALCISGVLLLTGGGIAWHAVETLQVLIFP